MPASKPQTKLLHVQMLRAFAALFVVVTHSLHEVKEMLASRGMHFDDKVYPGDFGVDIFFILSGFIMAYVSRDAFAGKGASLDFLRRRIIRVAPMYWIMTLVVVAIVILAPKLMDNGTKDFTHWLGSFLFLPVERPSDGLVRPLLGIGWTLHYEILFYVLFAVALIWPVKKAIPGVIVAISTIVLAGLLLQPENPQLRFWSDPIMLEFAAGVGLGWAYLNGVRLNFARFWGLMYWGLLILAFAPAFTREMEIWRVVYYGIPAFIIVLACVLTKDVDRRPIPPVLVQLGASSYTLYLTHPFVLGGLKVIWEKTGFTTLAGPMLLPWVFTVMGIGICVIVGHGIHLLVELPMTRFLSNFKLRKTANNNNSAEGALAR